MSVMEITCPNCATKFPMIAGLNDAEARRVASLMGKIPPKIAPLCLEYLALFKPQKSGLTWKRTHTLLRELTEGITAGQINRGGRHWAAPNEHWVLALQEVIDRRDKLTLPLKSHGYLYEILSGLTDKVEAKSEAKKEEQSRNRSSDGAETLRTVSVIRSEIEHFEGVLESTSSITKPYIQNQIDRLKKELAIVEKNHG